MNTTIVDAIACESLGGFYNDDQKAIKCGAFRDGFMYDGAPITPGFGAIRLPATAVSIGLKLSDGTVAWGDTMNVQYAGVSGREPRLVPKPMIQRIEGQIAAVLRGLTLRSFRTMNDQLFGESGALHGAPVCLKYGLSQALLTAVAHTFMRSPAEQICVEYALPLTPSPVPIYCQSGEDRYNAVDKMILRQADVLPHGLINHASLVGHDGQKLLDYVSWVAERVRRRASSDYKPVLHFDVYGCIGEVFSGDLERIADFLLRLERAAAPYGLQIEAPIDFGSLPAQVQGLHDLRQRLRRGASQLKLVADEWCNTLADFDAFIAAEAVDMIQIKMPDMGSLHDSIEGVLKCRRNGMGAYLGGSCTETDLSARMSMQVAIATQVDMFLAKPGMGVDEGFMVVANEQSRLLCLLKRRRLAAT